MVCKRRIPLTFPQVGGWSRAGWTEFGGSRKAWKRRPLDSVLKTYAAADVSFLHNMAAAWGKLMTPDEMNAAVSKKMLHLFLGSVRGYD
jgi:hypothetical protein